VKTVGVAVVVLWICSVLQFGFARYLAIFGVAPNFLLVATIAVSLCLPRPSSAVFGFFAGAIEGALVGANLAHYVVSRTVAGFVAAWSRGLRFELTAPAVGFTTLAVTLVASVVFLFTAAPRGIVGYLGDTIGSAMYNGVLAMPLYALLRRVLHPTVR
jgi:rod shape-determining protein MreD